MLDDLSENEDSLFGSPPPSPTFTPLRGRSPSPALALPSRGGSGSATIQNVGTIALPGSHACSELPITPLALSMSGFASHSRPQAQSTAPVPTSQNPPAASRSRSRAPTTTKRTKRAKSNASSRPYTPQISLPNAGESTPPNFLRNQSALLGLAGTIGGVNPAHLSKPRGSTPSNPIIVDEHDLSPIGHGENMFVVEAEHLPPPSNEGVIASLIQQKNIFPVLHSIIKLITASDATRPPPAFSPVGPCDSSSNNIDSASKRRKLRSVPSGAGDWDVPYPLPLDIDGVNTHVPQTSWERERGKQLVTQLASVIKSAAKKAATQAYVKEHGLQPKRALAKTKMNEPTEPNVFGHYRPITMTYGLEGAQPPTSIADASNVNTATNATPSLDEGLASSPETDARFDQILSALLNLTSEQDLHCLSEPASDTNMLGVSEGTDGFPMAASGDQDILESWMSMLSNAVPESLQQSQTFMPATDPTNMDVVPPTLTLHDSPPSPSAEPAIDPTLLAISQPVPRRRFFTPPTPTLTSSPIPSMSSPDLLTPICETPHAFPEPEVFNAEQAEDPISAAGMLLELASASTPAHAQVASALQPDLPMQGEKTTKSTRSMEPGVRAYKRCAAGPGRPPGNALKETLLARARERRRQLAAEIERAKVELWETTIEQGMLVQMAKEL